MTERWLPVVGYEGLYQVSDHGRVWSEPHWNVDTLGRKRHYEGRFLPWSYSGRGKAKYPTYKLYKNRAARGFPAHRLVLIAFVGPCPPGKESCHGDGDVTNIHVSNLRWDTKAANSADSVRHGTHSSARKTHCPREHEYRPDNLVRPDATNRQCLACTKARRHLYRRGADHSSAEFKAVADWYYNNPGKRWDERKDES